MAPKTLAPALAMGLAILAAATSAGAQDRLPADPPDKAGVTPGPSPAVAPTSLSTDSCPPPLTLPPVLIKAMQEHSFEKLLQSPPPEFRAFDEATKARTQADWPNLCRYRRADPSLLAKPAVSDRVVFLGDSITEGWAFARPLFFDGSHIVGRGIAGQVSGQILVRFRQDVVALRPRAVHIMIGTNDLAGAQLPISYEAIEDNIISMVQLARANHIVPILASVPPAKRFVLPLASEASPKIARLNDWLKAYAARERIIYVDYGPVLAAPDGAMRAELTVDGIHPNSNGYAAMEPLTRDAVARALSAP